MHKLTIGLAKSTRGFHEEEFPENADVMAPEGFWYLFGAFIHFGLHRSKNNPAGSSYRAREQRLLASQ